MQNPFLRIFLIFFLLSISSQKQYAQANDFEAGLYNVAVGSILGGIGAVINKEPDEKFGKTLLDGMAQGALGGYLIFESKRLVRKFSRTGNYAYVWPSKLVNAAGASIIENAAANGEFLETWHLNIGFNRIEFSTENKFKIRYRIMPFSLFSTIYYAANWKFNFDKSLKLGTFVFTSNKIIMPNGQNAEGAARTNSIVLRIINHENIAHELIHIYQYESFSVINSFFNKPREKFSENSKFLKIYTKIFYTDFNAVLHSGIYGLETLTADEYEDNFFEKEAFYYSR